MNIDQSLGLIRNNHTASCGSRYRDFKLGTSVCIGIDRGERIIDMRNLVPRYIVDEVGRAAIYACSPARKITDDATV